MPIEPIPTISLCLVWITAVLPLLAFAAIIIFLRQNPKTSAAISIGSVLISCACSILLLIRNWNMTRPQEFLFQWAVSGKIAIPFGFLIDPLSLLMLVIVSVISFLVLVYSLGYMSEDPGFSRYFAFMSLFAWSMICMTISSTLLIFYIFWELVGLSSYLLIGFWYEKFSATEAGKKAFMMTRIGDTAFFLGLLILFIFAGGTSITDMNAGSLPNPLSSYLITAVSLLIFVGIISKSAQFPLLTWLPDAMEGPTPVSALLHSSTMVAAGVYLFARLFPFFSQSQTAMTTALAIGTISMFMSATMATVSRDIKQIWAFSTISQFGFMIMALGAGGYFAGIFHLTTHAGFKALLFLCSGVLIHTYKTNDIFELGRMGSKTLKIPMICMVIAGAALSGLWPLSGFFSKEAIMANLSQLNNPIWLWVGLLGVFLTSHYTFRLIFIILFPREIKEAVAKSEEHSHHSEYQAMAWPVVIFAGACIVLGYTGSQLHRFLIPSVAEVPSGEFLTVVSILLVVLGIGMAWVEFGRKGAAQIGYVERIEGLRRFFEKRWYLDDIYAWLVDIFVDKGLSVACKKSDDKVVDGILHAIAGAIVKSGREFSERHRILIQSKLMVIFGVMFGLTLLVLVF